MVLNALTPAPSSICDDLVAGVDHVAALAVEVGQEPVGVVAAQVEGGGAGLGLDLLRGGGQLGERLGHRDARVLEDLLVVEEPEGVDDLRRGVGLALELRAAERLREVVVGLVEGGGAVQRGEVAEVGEVGDPGDLGAHHVRGAGVAARRVLELGVGVAERHAHILDVDLGVLLLEPLGELAVRRLLGVVGGVPERNGSGQFAPAVVVAAARHPRRRTPSLPVQGPLPARWRKCHVCHAACELLREMPQMAVWNVTAPQSNRKTLRQISARMLERCAALWPERHLPPARSPVTPRAPER